MKKKITNQRQDEANRLADIADSEIDKLGPKITTLIRKHLKKMLRNGVLPDRTGFSPVTFIVLSSLKLAKIDFLRSLRNDLSRETVDHILETFSFTTREEVKEIYDGRSPFDQTKKEK